jgi:plastocyanin
MAKGRRARSRLSIAVIAAFVFALAVPTVIAVDKSVAIRDFAFGPKTLTIRVGDTVTWTNRDSVAHTATARGGTFDTGPIPGGRSRSVRFTVAGTYRYICTPHPSMTGSVIVQAAGGGLRPPDTDTAVAVEAGGSGDPPFAGLAVIGGLAYLAAVRLLRRRVAAVRSSR